MARRRGGAAAFALLLFLTIAPAALAQGADAHPAGAAPSSQKLELVFPLAADLAGLKRFALAVTTPGSPQYGAYEPVAELARRFGASASTRRRVRAYLRAAGAHEVRIDPTGLLARATLTVRLAQRLFATSLQQ